MKHCMSFAKGMGMGIVAGIAISATVKCVCKNSKTLKRKAGKTARAVSDIVSDIQALLN